MLACNQQYFVEQSYLQRTCNAGSDIHGSKNAIVDRPLAQWDSVCDNQNRARENSSRANSRYGSSTYKANRVLSGRASHTANFEDEQGNEVYQLDRIEVVELAVDQRRRTIGE